MFPKQTPKSPITRCSYGQETSFPAIYDKSGFGDFGDWDEDSNHSMLIYPTQNDDFGRPGSTFPNAFTWETRFECESAVGN